MKLVLKVQYSDLLSKCNKGKHKLRQNKYGVIWCVHCGLLSTATDAIPLSEYDKILIR